MITVVLVRTHSPGNLGAAARVAANFGARLRLVDPRADRSHPDALAFASDGAALLETAVLDSVEGATAGSELSVALTSMRARRGTALPPATTFAAIRRAARTEVTLVFGPERSGLRTEEVLACDARLRLPTEPAHPTMNLAQAVAVTLALVRGGKAEREPGGEPMPAATRRRIDAELRRRLEERFPERRARPDAVDELIALFRRGKPTRREGELLLAALSSRVSRSR